MVVDVGFTVVEAISVLVLKEPGVMATEEAFVMLQESVLVPAEATTEGEAKKEETVGRRLEMVVPLAIVDDAEMFPTLSSAVR